MRAPVWQDAVRSALDAMESNRGRSALTILSVMIGVASIVFCVSAGSSLGDFLTAQMATLGTDLMWVRPDDGAGSGTRVRGLEHRDALALAALESVRQASPRAGRPALITAEGAKLSGDLVAVYPGYFPMRNKAFTVGRPLLDADLRLARRVCVVGPKVLERLLYRTRNPLGRVVRVDGRPLVVVGVLRGSDGGLKTPGLEEDAAVFVPLTTAEQLFGVHDLDVIFFQPQPSASREELRQRVFQLLLARKGSRAGYQIDSLEERLKQLGNVVWVVVLVFGGISAVALLVAGVGIMNIMLLSVRERTREIGIRKSVGARRGHILAQFFSEAVVLSGGGGIVGVLAGAAGVGLLAAITGGVVALSWPGVAVAFLVALATGLFFGLYPALRAANLQPAEALARETT